MILFFMAAASCPAFGGQQESRQSSTAADKQAQKQAERERKEAERERKRKEKEDARLSQQQAGVRCTRLRQKQ